MTPLIPHHDPDERPTTGEIVGAIILAIVVGFALWFAAIIHNPIPKG